MPCKRQQNFRHIKETITIKGANGKNFIIDKNNKPAEKLAMLFEAHCTIDVQRAMEKYGYTEQRYYHLLKKYNESGSEGLKDKKRGSDKRPVRNKETTNQIIVYINPKSTSSINRKVSS